MGEIKIIHNKIRKYRKERGYTQKWLADLLNIDRSTYAYYESGRIKPDIHSIMKLCKIFNINYEDILESETDAQNNLYDSNFSHSSQSGGNATYMYNLTKKEQEIILYYRLLSAEKKEEIRNEIIKKHKNK
ncbi:MAG: helix-turn-helix transcriptional regulator [Oscillospiraceae bacterium]|jgi:transcriptional regulator with XRE-family HTH domain|nr:helix-turn-helix transcriptional regulator [Oscillospiraceae bacterium]